MSNGEYEQVYRVVVSTEESPSDFRGCQREEWFLGDVLHRDHDLPAVILRDSETNEVLREEYWQHDQLSRENGPAVVMNFYGQRRFEYRIEGKRHRLDGPAIQETLEETGVVCVEEWAIDGKTMREGGPAFVLRDQWTGIANHEEWIHPTKGAHREGAPAQIFRDEKTGICEDERWMQNGLLHRPLSEGPAIIKRDRQTGAVIDTEYYQHGKRIGRSSRPSTLDPK